MGLGDRMGGVGGAERVAQAGDGGLGIVHLLLNDLRAFAVRRGKRGEVGENLGIAKNGGKRIVDFVRGTGGETPEGGEFFRMNGLSLNGFEIFERGLRKAHEVPEFLSEKGQFAENQAAQEQ